MFSVSGAVGGPMRDQWTATIPAALRTSSQRGERFMSRISLTVA